MLDTRGDVDAVFPDGGEMGARCRAFDWASTPLGPVSEWSQSLRTMVGAVLNSRNPMLLFWGPDLVQFYNDAFRPSLGGERADGSPGRDAVALGARARDFWADVWPVVGAQLEGVYVRGEAVAYEDQLIPIDRNGRREDVWWTYSYSPVRDDDGSIGGIFVVCLETTRRVLAEGHLRDVFAQAPVGVAVLVGPQHVYEIANDRYLAEMAGGRPLVGMPVRDAFPESGGQGYFDLLDTVYTSGKPVSLPESRMTIDRAGRGDVDEYFYDLRLEPLRDVGGEVYAVVVIAADVTEQVRSRAVIERTRAETAAAEQRLRDVVEQTNVAVAVLEGRDHVYTLVSPRYANMVGMPRELLGRPVRAVFPDIVGQGIFEVLDRVFETGEPYFATERSLTIDRDGDGVEESYVYDLGYIPLRDANGDVYAIASVSNDVTERVRAREAIEAARMEAELARVAAEEANQAKSAFLATMSHELRTPLNAIGGYVELLELGIRGPVTDAQRADLTRIQASQRHLLGLINDVLNYAKLETGAVRYDLEDVRVDDALRQAEGLVIPQVRAKGLALNVAPVTPELRVRADAEKLRQILANLLSNAVKFTEPGGSIALAADSENRVVRLAVRDSGIGIPADKLDVIFEPFVQVRGDLTRTAEGTGLGLAISRDLARGMGGDLTVASTLGSGSTFTLTLPRA